MAEGQVLVLDGRGHLLGRLAAIVAKQVLLGRKVVVVRCEGINISGNFYRNKLKYLAFLRKRMNTKPSHGPYHFQAPSHIFWRTHLFLVSDLSCSRRDLSLWCVGFSPAVVCGLTSCGARA
ncbi:hypothetical protein J1605_021942 [Eschrichtius robustus]|uniref:Large ribosomal subunit protein uL13 n=1 Tax=Eschrichtius robustus TaxID=9764 RepID=A0AB34HEJ6_ESCRO|nr:hypothetical protein J1605_021942 [Eschrichtius robustus]